MIKMTDRKMTIWLHVAFWLVLGVLNLVLSNWFLDPGLNIWRPLINHVVLALLFYANAWLVNLFLEKKKYVPYIALANVMIWVTVPCRFYINKQSLLQSGVEPLSLERGLLFGAVATGYGIVMLSTIYQVLINRYAAERKALAIINRQTEAELQFLRAQINPHFLFNTLNNIYSLAVVRSPKTADMVLKLSQLLRYVVYEKKGDLVPLEKEVEHIRHFIELFQMRNEEPQDIEFTAEGELNGVKIEPMILIPIVENCFKHCDFDTNPKAFVKMQLTVREGELTFNTANTKNDADQQKDRTGGVGLENIHRRLALQHPDDFQLETHDELGLFKVFFVLKVNA
ncbi:MAG: histidine kinase [Saprospiraceae bacterium]|nr:histidine kinase [Saprospiraceae bacterium]MCF8251811.1 histidine kinase [Saprospiraceae bacterium]MCF8281465.1 histidine kinase [Bacteroidales bacterium]MCF8313525.1 histidine kinase [Saprospiraceae bacterium]MCF8442252.1 histidine kinase [Saprospiraceae bacterium]